MATFKKGDELTADALNSVVAPVVSAAASGKKDDRRARREILKSSSGFRFGFQLSVRHGVLEYRRGLVELGPGDYMSVGESEWNVAGDFDGACYVVLSVYPEARTATVDVRSSPVASGGREFLLGIIKHADGGGEGWYFVQTDGGLLSVCAPRGVRGWVNPTWNAQENVNTYGCFDLPELQYTLGEWHNSKRDAYGRPVGGCFGGFYNTSSGVEMVEALDGRGRVMRNMTRLTFSSTG